MAQGNLNVTIPEDLGVFDPFKPQIYRDSRTGFQGCGGGGGEEPADEGGADHECIPRL